MALFEIFLQDYTFEKKKTFCIQISHTAVSFHVKKRCYECL